MKKGLFSSVFAKLSKNEKDETNKTSAALSDYDEQIGRWTILVRYGKEKTPELSEKIFREISERTDRCALILMDYNQKEQMHASENMSWLYDVKYELLNCTSVHQIIAVGKRSFDYKVRCLLAGVAENLIHTTVMTEAVQDMVHLSEVDTVCFLAAPSTYVPMEAIKEELVKIMKKEEEI